MMEDLVQGGTAIDVTPSGHPGSEARIWAARIAECWRQSTEAIIRAGQLLIEAKRAVGHGGWGDVLAGLPFGERQAQMLMAIAADIRLANPQRIALLPPSWPAIYDLTRLADDELERGFEQKIIRPDMIRADVEQIRALTRPQPIAATGEPADKLHPSNAGMDGSGDTPSAAGSPVSVDRQSVDHVGQAPMPSGGLAIAHRRDPADKDPREFFPTPPWATRALIEHVFPHLGRPNAAKYASVWEPACGEGHMAETLKEYFKDVIASDKYAYDYPATLCDFLTEGKDVGADWIITNPPFRPSTDFVLKALALAHHGVAMFVRLTWLESAGRYENIFAPYPPTLLAIFSERVPLHKGRWEHDGATMTAYLWVVWIKGAEPRPPFWIPPICRKTLTKADDAKRFGVIDDEEDEAA